MAKKLKKEPLQCGMFEADGLNHLGRLVKGIKKTWDQMPAEKQQQAREFIEDHKCIGCFEELNALLSVASRNAYNLYDALLEVVNESPDFKEFITPEEDEEEEQEQ